MSFSHMLILAIIALVVIPPDKLPEVARSLARMYRDLRRSTVGIWDDLKEEAMLKPEDLLKHKTNTEPENKIQPENTEKKPNE